MSNEACEPRCWRPAKERDYRKKLFSRHASCFSTLKFLPSRFLNKIYRSSSSPSAPISLRFVYFIRPTSDTTDNRQTVSTGAHIFEQEQCPNMDVHFAEGRSVENAAGEIVRNRKASRSAAVYE